MAGESGSGKTTLAMLLLGFIQPTTGQILYSGKDITQLRGDERLTFRREVQAVFQDPFAVFNPFYHSGSSADRADQALQAGQDRSAKRAARWTRRSRRWACARRTILGRFPHQLSRRPAPTHQRGARTAAKAQAAGRRRAGLDGRRVAAREHPGKLCATCNVNYGVSIIYITHDLTTAYHIAKSIIVLYRGSVMEAGDVDA